MYQALEKEADDELWKAGVPTKRFKHSRFAQCRYEGQTWDIDVPVSGKIDKKALAAIAQKFHKMHFEEHTYDRKEEDVMVSSLRVRSRALLSKPPMQKLPGTSSPAKASGNRQAYFGNGFVKTAVYDGPKLRANQSVKGPAIIEEPFTTIVVPPRWTVKLDKFGNYVASK